jgi:hypothetical protein
MVACVIAAAFAGFSCPAGTGILNASHFCSLTSSYCPLGSAAPLTTPVGSYAVPTPEGLYFNATVCEPGRYCIGGVATPCPAGRYGDQPEDRLATCVGNCSQGYFCSGGSVRPDQQPCGSEGVFCPAVRMDIVARAWARGEKGEHTDVVYMGVVGACVLVCVLCMLLVCAGHGAHPVGGCWLLLCARERTSRPSVLPNPVSGGVLLCWGCSSCVFRWPVQCY